MTADDKDKGKGDKMNLKRFMLAIASVALLAAVMASSASAAAWHVGGSELSGSETVACTVGEYEGAEKLELEWEITGFGPLVFTGTGINCVNSTIFNEGGSAKDAGELQFTGVTIDGEIGTVCSVENNTVTTNRLESELVMHAEDPEVVFDKFVPAEERVNFAVLHIVGASCPIAGNRAIRGNASGQAAYPTGTPALTQSLTFSAAVEATAGSNLRIAGNPAHLIGTVVNALSGANAGEEFWAE